MFCRACKVNQLSEGFLFNFTFRNIISCLRSQICDTFCSMINLYIYVSYIFRKQFLGLSCICSPVEILPYIEKQTNWTFQWCTLSISFYWAKKVSRKNSKYSFFEKMVNGRRLYNRIVNSLLETKSRTTFFTLTKLDSILPRHERKRFRP